jgi:HD-GYP domain-containing protein (c-di-GMP phosphodiesterase class II)
MNRTLEVYIDSLISALPGVSNTNRPTEMWTVLLFNQLLRSNEDFIRAYEDTLEGWSQALELRDPETIWHTRRVVQMTVRLARLLGFQQEELTLISRGTLLHDVGKIGIPDQILLKPGPLNPEEWEIMRQHPVLAYELLSTIPGLQPSIDIPYCHHEKWDGTGYPRGLKGDEIPIAARIFAIVDVWDALTSDRPYRKAWTFEQARDYIRLERGQHFDPRICDAFLYMITNSQWLRSANAYWQVQSPLEHAKSSYSLSSI